MVAVKAKAKAKAMKDFNEFNVNEVLLKKLDGPWTMSKPFKTKVPGTSCKPAYTKNQAQRHSRPGFQFGRGLLS